jgi:hypothetical protein
MNTLNGINGTLLRSVLHLSPSEDLFRDGGRTHGAGGSPSGLAKAILRHCSTASARDREVCRE